MKFSDQEIAIAKQLRAHGLEWGPAVGHYVWDESGACAQPSPFQDRIYYILNYDYFMRLIGGVDRFKDVMVWLPTWYDCRVILRSLGVSDVEVAKYLSEADSIAQGREQESLLLMILSVLNDHAVRSE